MKTAWSLNFKRIGTSTLSWDRLFWLWNWNSSRLMVPKLTIAKNWKRSTKKVYIYWKTVAAEEEQEAPVPLVTHVNNILHSTFSTANLQFKWCAHKSYFSNNFNGAISVYKPVLHCEVYDYEEFPDEIMESPLSELFFRRTMKMLSRPDSFMLYGKLGVDFSTTSELLYPNMKIRLRLIRARTNSYMISYSPNVSAGIVHCSLYTHRIALKDDCHKKRM